MTDPAERLAEFLAPALVSYRTRTGTEAAAWRGRALSAAEATGFLRAIDAGIVVIDSEAAICTIPELGVSRGGKRYQLYMTYDGGTAHPGPALTWSWQEMFDQIAFAAELVLDHGWPTGSVQLEVDRLDVVAGPPDLVLTRPLLGAEVKLTDTGGAGLAAMMAVFGELNGTGPPATVGSGVRRNAEPKYQALQRLRPAVFVEVAPGVRRAHSLTHHADGTVVFEPRPHLPRPGELGWDAP